MLCLPLLDGCYYMQAVHGQMEVLRQREPLDRVIADPDTGPELAARLRLLKDARRFATERLLLPDNDSYRTYADLERDYVVWNVIAAPEFSMRPKTWCYLIVGCVAYRGYFSRDGAERTARALREDGYDVFVGGVAAYSTLGRFADPILNTMMARDDTELVALLFHELAHQRLYIKDDTEFNESFASAVAEIGLRQWLTERREPAALSRWRERQSMHEALTAQLQAAKEDLQRLYASTLPAEEMRQRKQRRLQRLADIAAQTAARNGGGNWLGGELNNARLASLSLYRGKVAAFLGIYDRCGEQLDCFYRDVEEIAAMSAERRELELASPR